MLIDEAGRIEMVGPSDLVPSPPDAVHHHYDACALLPGLINTHTHLELTGLGGIVEDDDFAAWIGHLIAVKAARTDEMFFESAQRGIASCWKQGVTTICDTGSTGQVIAALESMQGSGFVHHEVFGMHPDEASAALRNFSRDLDRLARHAVGRVVLGVSPHAPYTVSGPLYRGSAELARAHGAPLAVHVAEPAAESSLLRDFTGSFAEIWRARGIPRPSPVPVTPVAWLEMHGVLGERTQCIHVIDADAADVALLASHRCSIAHCPRSNRRHHHADAPLRAFVEAGLRIGLGTDSEVSVDPIDLIEEARAAQALAGWSAEEALRAATLGGAEALAIDRVTGSLEAGKWADVIAVDIGAAPTAAAAAVLAAGTQSVVATWLGGRALYRRPISDNHH